jgi:hypothetical protein
MKYTAAIKTHSPHDFTISVTIHEYLWFADRSSNPIYRVPELFVCFKQPPPYFRLADQRDPSAGDLGCPKFDFDGPPMPAKISVVLN